MSALCTSAALSTKTQYTQNTHMSRTYKTKKLMHLISNIFDTTYRLSFSFLFTHITPRPTSIICVQSYCVANTSTDRTHTSKRDTKATNLHFSRPPLNIHILFLTLFQITLVIDRVIMVNWFKPNPKLLTFLVFSRSRYFTVYSWFSFGFLF
jgi:hypothetical protein